MQSLHEIAHFRTVDDGCNSRDEDGPDRAAIRDVTLNAAKAWIAGDLGKPACNASPFGREPVVRLSAERRVKGRQALLVDGNGRQPGASVEHGQDDAADGQ